MNSPLVHSGTYNTKRWYKDSILINLDGNVKNSLVLIAIESSNDSLSLFYQIDFTLQTFSTAKTAVNITLETNSDCELIQLLKEFIAVKHQRNIEVDNSNYNLEKINIIERSAQNANIVPLEKDLVDQITDPNVTKICVTLSKRKIKNALELSKKKEF
ncbi:hypothetical protein C1645_826074 [Glomus cerebriforme]|uniref:Uncharacterized protein n=1 Tax=Glomus cerebriforme TaxID=658196 RepID=A0A397SSC5_9GLOM|nr:hypothetical protein C1645_826074 [Glomus cerebriforme]